ncbi:hypothetical protein B0H66DRAFT_607829 [Apodospora peruviana]|uniref:AA1-like domain-containing protein n=1 Tax=Apodospora peruviana TaxID=516989 RepID=A0AAE0HTU1_9PEZI|nr:hypothetical protein B0H66DRAFT_607829 [Apodospora peruviana]
MRSLFVALATLLLRIQVATPAAQALATRPFAAPCQEVSNNPIWQITDFTYSDSLTGGSESSLSRVIDMTFSVTNNAVSSSSSSAASCSAHDSLDKGEAWDPKAWHTCSRGAAAAAPDSQKNRTAAVTWTQFAFDISNNNLTITETWGCAASAQGNM